MMQYITLNHKLYQNIGPATQGSAGIDLHVDTASDIIVESQKTIKLGTGLKVFISTPLLVGLVVPRSSSVGLTLVNTVGVIDSDYQGEIILHLANSSTKPILIMPYERVAQLLIVPVCHPEFKKVNCFTEVTKRGQGGFGSTSRIVP